MVIDIIAGISVQLKNKYSDGYGIYSEDAEQGTQPPCFYIKLQPTTVKALLGSRKQITYPFDIQYITSGGNEEKLMILEELIDILEYITLKNGDMLRGKNMNGEIIDGVLHFHVEYSTFRNSQTVKIPMEEHGLKVGTKREDDKLWH